MDKQAAKQQIRDFLGDTEITFSVTSHENGEWEAQCDQIAGLSVCGDAADDFDYLIRDAIVTAAGVGVEYVDMVSFVGNREQKQTPQYSPSTGSYIGIKDLGYATTASI